MNYGIDPREPAWDDVLLVYDPRTGRDREPPHRRLGVTYDQLARRPEPPQPRSLPSGAFCFCRKCSDELRPQERCSQVSGATLFDLSDEALVAQEGGICPLDVADELRRRRYALTYGEKPRRRRLAFWRRDDG